MPTISPLTPQPAGTVSITASTASANVALPGGGGSQVRLLNNASILVYVAFGASTVTASTSTDMPLAPGGIPERFTIDANTSKISYMAAIASAATTLPLYATRGEGF
jgi:hypothetical protein